MKKIRIEKKQKYNNFIKKIIKYKFKRIVNKKINSWKRKRKKYFIVIFFIIIFTILYQKIFFSKNKIKTLFHTSMNNNPKIDYNNLIEVMNRYKRENIIWPIKNYLKFIPVLSDNELEAFCYFMKPKNIYFEFGSGGSTNVASFYNMTSYSVESDKNWHRKLKRNGIKTNYITIDLKVINSYGKPGPGTTVEDWKKYIQAYKAEYNADIILIDGRFRVACALDIFSKIRNDAIVLIHDYSRVEYHIVEDYYFKIKEWDSLAAFIKKPNISSIPLDIYNKYLYIKM